MKSTKQLGIGSRSSINLASRDRRLRLVEANDAAHGSSAWTDIVLNTSQGQVAVRQTPGRKMPIVFLHGSASSMEVFRGQMESDAGTQYRMIAIDLPGHGASDDATDAARSYSISGYADLTIEVLEMLGIDHAAFFGWSLGGHVALELMDRFPGTTGLIISGTPPVGKSPDAVLAGFKLHPDRILPERDGRTEAEWQAARTAALGGASDRSLDHAFHRTDSRARRAVLDLLTEDGIADHKRVVETSGIPVAVVNGADDPFVNVEYLAGLRYAKLWSRKCLIIPRTGHAPFLEQPKIFNAILKRFLRRMEGRLRAQLNHPSLCFSG